ncbi:MAG: hypothetical protein RML72_10475 [Bacteroidia bacterium]|nr:hypothetical protein [Bacteroidia bacterium]MDW8159284.1 hypothetical protein [Bacteroidia bacterium]
MKPYPINDEQIKIIIQDQVPLLLEKKFSYKTFICGEEILEFSSNPQLNKFILFQIYQEWNAYINKISHPYFDFSHSEVKNALKNFQNVLSRHIKIDKFDFRILVEKAYFNKLKLIINPVETLVNFFYLSKDRVTTQVFEKYANYFSDFDFILNGILTYYKKNGSEYIDKNGFIEKMHKIVAIYEEKTGSSIDIYRNQLFKELTGRDISFLQPESIDTLGCDLHTNSSLLQEETNTVFNNITLDSNSSLYQDVKSTNLAQEILSHPIAEKEPVLSTSQEAIATPLVSTAASNKPASNTITPLGIASSEAPKTIAQQFSNANVNTLHKFVSHSQGIKLEQIPIHKQFQFIQKIFSGNATKFKETIEKINSFSSYKEAEEYLNTRILNKPDVSKTDAITLEFIQMVKHKFEAQ